MPKIKNKKIKKIIFSLIIGIAVTLTVSVLALINPLRSWHYNLSNLLFTRNSPSDQIVIVNIDESSRTEQTMRQGLGKFKNWSVKYYADVINKLNENGAKVIGLDLLLDQPSRGISESSLNEAIIQSQQETDPQKSLNDKINQYSAITNLSSLHPDDEYLIDVFKSFQNIVIAYQYAKIINNINIQSGNIIPPYQKFIDAVKNTGITNFIQDDDKIVRSMPLILKDENGNEYKSFDLHIAELFDSSKTTNLPLENGNLLINFFGGPNSYQRVSFEDVYNENFDTGIFKDKIVLIGLTSSSVVLDEALVPTSINSKMPGVEVHANAIQTILEGKFLRNTTMFEQIGTILFLSLLGILILLYLNIWYGIVFALVILIAYTGTAHAAYSNGIIVNMVYPYIAILLTYFGSIVYKYFTELREKSYIENAFGKYLSPNVMKEVIDNPATLHLGGTKKEVTVFFSDIENFTTLSEELAPEVLIKQLNEYLSAMTNIVMRNEGTLDKYVGDAIVAYFGAPVSQENHAVKACQTALEMRIALQNLHDKWNKEGKKLLDFRAGINTGEVIVGNVGSEKRFDYTIIGDTVNLGSRLEGANKKYETHLMISESTKAKINDEFITRELDIIIPKGKKKPVRVYELLARKGVLSEIGLKLIESYNNAKELYNKHNFQLAYDAFQETLKIYPDDGPSKLYLQRSEILRDFPPAADWDGVFTMKDK